MDAVCKVVVFPGDNCGPEVIDEALKVRLPKPVLCRDYYFGMLICSVLTRFSVSSKPRSSP